MGVETCTSLLAHGRPFRSGVWWWWWCVVCGVLMLVVNMLYFIVKGFAILPNNVCCSFFTAFHKCSTAVTQEEEPHVLLPSTTRSCADARLFTFRRKVAFSWHLYGTEEQMDESSILLKTRCLTGS